MPKTYKEDETLKAHTLSTFNRGYNSYSGGKSTVEDEEYPYGLNIVPDYNGSNTKRAGRQRFGAGGKY